MGRRACTPTKGLGGSRVVFSLRRRHDAPRRCNMDQRHGACLGVGDNPLLGQTGIPIFHSINVSRLMIRSPLNP